MRQKKQNMTKYDKYASGRKWLGGGRRHQGGRVNTHKEVKERQHQPTHDGQRHTRYKTRVSESIEVKTGPWGRRKPSSWYTFAKYFRVASRSDIGREVR